MIKVRLWDYRLIKYLPKQQLVSQWRELIAIKRQWEKGTLKHRLVSYVMDYPKYVFRNYILDVVGEMDNRNIKYQKKYFAELIKFCEDEELSFETLLACYPEHNDRYLKQCLYNLEEKFDRKIITQEEWDNILYNVGYELYQNETFK